MQIIKGKLLTFNEYNNRIQMVFENNEQYLIVTVRPNWELPDFKVGEDYFLEYIKVEPGTTTWYNPDTDQHIPYKYRANYVEKIIPADAVVKDSNYETAKLTIYGDS